MDLAEPASERFSVNAAQVSEFWRVRRIHSCCRRKKIRHFNCWQRWKKSCPAFCKPLGRDRPTAWASSCNPRREVHGFFQAV